jgi:hypothetical protein
MSDRNNASFIIDLIERKKVDFLTHDYDMLEESVKIELKKWLLSKNFPADDPEELVGKYCVICWFNDNSKLLVFGFSYEGVEQCGGSILFSLESNTCKFISDTVECSSLTIK